MAYKKWVISLGGSRIIPDEVDYEFLKDFKRFILQNSKDKFVVVTGGGMTARKYMNALRGFGKSIDKQSEAGIDITRFHANFLMKIFGKPANDEIPYSVKKVKALLNKNKVVFCGALRFNHRQTTDATSAKIADFLDCSLINLTNVKGLYTHDPKKYKNAKLVKSISWKHFYDIAKKIKFKAGQHFVLDQKAAKIIMKKKIVTYIIGSLKQAGNVIKNKKFLGTVISG